MDFQKKLLRELKLPDNIVEAGGKLKRGGTVLQKTWMPDSHRKRSLWTSIRQTKTVIGAVLRMRTISDLPADVTRMIRFFRGEMDTPDDTTFLLGGDNYLKEIFAEASAGLLHRHSGLGSSASAENLLKADMLKRSGEKISIDIFPHTSLFDPHALRGILMRTRDRTHGTLRDVSGGMLEGTVFVVGQKVGLSRIQRTFSPFEKLMTIQPRYQAADETFARVHNKVVGRIAGAIRQNRDWWLAVYPEAGRTKNHQIGVDERVARMMAMARDEWHLPMFLDMPPDLFDPDKDMRDVRQIPAKLFVGQPFQLDSIPYIPATRQALRAAGAPIEKFQWGHTRMHHEAPPSDANTLSAWKLRVAQSGLEESFTPIA